MDTGKVTKALWEGVGYVSTWQGGVARLLQAVLIELTSFQDVNI
jgi:hypothetical protein